MAAGAGYALSALAVVVAAALMAAATAGQSIRATPVAAHTPKPVAAPMPTPAIQSLTFDQLKVGDCIQGPRNVNTASNWPDVVSVVPCTKRHLAEVYYSANRWPAAMAFPGNSAIFSQADTECHKAFHTYDGVAYAVSEYSYYYLSPQGRDDWDSGDRQLMCIAYFWTKHVPRGKPLFESIKGTFQ